MILFKQNNIWNETVFRKYIRTVDLISATLAIAAEPFANLYKKHAGIDVRRTFWPVSRRFYSDPMDERASERTLLVAEICTSQKCAQTDGHETRQARPVHRDHTHVLPPKTKKKCVRLRTAAAAAACRLFVRSLLWNCKHNAKVYIIYTAVDEIIHRSANEHNELTKFVWYANRTLAAS